MKNSKYLFLVLFLLVTTVSFAQPGFEEDVEDVASIPGMLIAAAAAIGIAVSKLRNKN